MLKKIFLIGLLVLMITATVHSAFTTSIDNRKTYKNSYRWTGKPKDKLLDWAKEVEDRADGTTGNELVFFLPTTAPATTKGFLYFDLSLDALVLRTASGWETLEAGGGFASLDEAYNGGPAITVDNGAVTLTAPNANDNVVLAIVQSDSGTTKGLTLTNAGTGNTIDIQGQSSANDIEGTGNTWKVTSAGIATLVGLIVTTEDIVLENGEIINNATNDVILLDTGSEDLTIDFTTGDNIITLGSNSTGATSIDVGDFVTLTQLHNVVFEPAAGTISLAGTTNDWDLTISQSGTVDSSLILSSAGSVTDALSLLTTDVLGVIKISSSDTIDIDSADNITIDLAAGDLIIAVAAGSYTLNAEEAVDNAIDIDSAAGGYDLDVALSIGITSSEDSTDAIVIEASAGGIDIFASGGAAADDIDIVATGTSINITSTENDVAAIVIQENGGSSGGINIYANQGQGASATAEHDASVQLHSDDGGIGLYSGGNVTDAIRIETDGGSGATLHIQAIKGTGASAASENDASIQLESTVGGIGLLSKLNGADGIRLETDGGTGATLNIYADQGTAHADGAASIQLLSDDGAIGLKATTETAAGEKASAIQLTALAGAIELYSGLNATNTIKLTADGGTNSDIVIFNDTGNTVDSIQLLTDLGGITLTATKAFKIEAALTLNDTQAIAESDATPDVGGFSFFETHTTTDTIDDFDGTDIEEGQIIVVISQGAITYDVTAGALICGTTDLITANGDVTMWIYDGTNWQLLSWMDDAVDQNGRG